ncbi:LysM peptidoglycan-binding domain-containing protein [Paenarthrobacter sp. NyZ202]|uniref:LysM peptidoglycan-binding domain-containing protein n=1 Tax=Paenarthrobacter sp. NyZ202 TaxID=3402689 RepID=UPI003CE99A9D
MGQDDEATEDQSAARQAAEDAAAVGVSSADTAAAESAAAQATEQQHAANAAAAQEAARVGLNPDDPEVRGATREAASEAAAAAGQRGPVAPPVQEVVVEAGDTMGGIARQFGVDLAALIAANTDTVPNPDRIFPGQVLRLP